MNYSKQIKRYVEDFDDHTKLSVTVLTLIPLFNSIIVISFLIANMGGSGFNITVTGLYVLATIELAVIIGAYWGSKPRNRTAHFEDRGYHRHL